VKVEVRGPASDPARDTVESRDMATRLGTTRVISLDLESMVIKPRPSGNYWAMKHYTYAAHRGSKRFDTQGGLEGVAHVAFVNPDGAKTVVLSNTGAARKVQLRLGNLMTEVSLPANSVTNLSWV
jgi:hypothetical protein